MFFFFRNTSCLHQLYKAQIMDLIKQFKNISVIILQIRLKAHSTFIEEIITVFNYVLSNQYLYLNPGHFKIQCTLKEFYSSSVPQQFLSPYFTLIHKNSVCHVTMNQEDFIQSEKLQNNTDTEKPFQNAKQTPPYEQTLKRVRVENPLFRSL